MGLIHPADAAHARSLGVQTILSKLAPSDEIVAAVA